MTAPTRIRQLIEAARETTLIGDSDFPTIVGGFVKDTTGKEGMITSLSPLVVTAQDDTILTGDLTPLYPYFNNGSVLKSVTQLSKINTKHYPLFILDTLDRGESVNGMYNTYDVRAFLTMLGEDRDNADQFAEVYEQGLEELADWCIMVLRESMFTNEQKIYRERWGDASQYGRTDENVFNKLTDAVEITGDFTFNPRGGCNY